MPAIRNERRRRPSMAVSPNPNKEPALPRAITFAPNVTPGTYVPPDAEDNYDDLDPSVASGLTSDPLFPPAEGASQTQSRRRQPPGKRRSMGYIPRPPNAFMLFRANFVKQKHVPGSIEANHGSLSKIIGNCWRALPLEERNIWEMRARTAKHEHKILYPEYRFRPVHNKEKKARRAAAAAAEAAVAAERAEQADAEDRRCFEVSSLLMEGKKGNELLTAFDSADYDYDRLQFPASRSMTPLPMHLGHRRSSSVPLPAHHPQAHPFNPIAIPSLPAHLMPLPDWTSHSRPVSPVLAKSIRAARQAQVGYGIRRASSTQPILQRNWGNMNGMGVGFGMNGMGMGSGSTWYEADEQSQGQSPLPDVDTSLLNPEFQFGQTSAGMGMMNHSSGMDFNPRNSFSFANFLRDLPDYTSHAPSQNDTLTHPHISPLESIAPHEQMPLSAVSTSDCSSSGDDSIHWLSPFNTLTTPTDSYPPSSYSNSGSSSPSSAMALNAPQLPNVGGAVPHLVAPQPQHVFARFDGFSWSGATATTHGNGNVNMKDPNVMNAVEFPNMQTQGGMGLRLDFDSNANNMGVVGVNEMQQYSLGVSDFQVGPTEVGYSDMSSMAQVQEMNYQYAPTSCGMMDTHQLHHGLQHGQLGFEMSDYIHEEAALHTQVL